MPFRWRIYDKKLGIIDEFPSGSTKKMAEIKVKAIKRRYKEMDWREPELTIKKHIYQRRD